MELFPTAGGGCFLLKSSYFLLKPNPEGEYRYRSEEATCRYYALCMYLLVIMNICCSRRSSGRKLFIEFENQGAADRAVVYSPKLILTTYRVYVCMLSHLLRSPLLHNHSHLSSSIDPQQQRHRLTLALVPGRGLRFMPVAVFEFDDIPSFATIVTIIGSRSLLRSRCPCRELQSAAELSRREPALLRLLRHLRSARSPPRSFRPPRPRH